MVPVRLSQLIPNHPLALVTAGYLAVTPFKQAVTIGMRFDH
jgi:hypothetical protein